MSPTAAEERDGEGVCVFARGRVQGPAELGGLLFRANSVETRRWSAGFYAVVPPAVPYKRGGSSSGRGGGGVSNVSARLCVCRVYSYPSAVLANPQQARYAAKAP